MLADRQRQRLDDACRVIDNCIRKGAIRGVHSRLVAEGMLAAVQRTMHADFLSEARPAIATPFAPRRAACSTVPDEPKQKLPL